MNLLGTPFEFPEVPFVTDVPGRVKVGLIIRVQGKIPKRAVRFSINLATGREIYQPMSDIGFHFNPRFDLDCVVRNSLIDGIWGKEEGESPSNLPLDRSRAFEIMIKVESDHFKVAIDGVHFLRYDHRVPIEFLNTLQILGDVKVYKLEFLDSSPSQPMYGFQPSAIPLIEPLEIYNPVIPLVNEIPGGNRVGLVIRMHGKVSKRAHEFMVNIAAGPYLSDPRSDIGFHFNPRFDCGYVARNTMIGETWGIEESDNPEHLPFAERQTFELSILVESLRFQASVNGLHFLHYNHRVPLDLLNTLQILGDVRISKLEFLNLNAPILGMVQPPLGFIEPPREIFNPAVPFRQVLHGGMKIGKTIFITGRPKPYADRFSINFEKTREVADIVFHMNPRFASTNEPTPVVVRNHLFEGVWGKEERDTPAFPFLQGFNFDMTIICEEEFYLVAVNGQHLLSFRHRVPFEIADTLYIEGDVDIMLLKF